jgi:mannose/cellobiose epimerase-like protein (N-acyl-D-glucosamine 2-epimerase family)
VDARAVKSLQSLNSEIQEWLVRSAYPLWSARGIDARSGGFVEALDQMAIPLDIPRRVRVQARQVYAFAQAGDLGWRGNAIEIAVRGIEYLETRYRRRDGLFRALIRADGAVLDEQAVLYDQVFVLLGYASAARLLPSCRRDFEARALELRLAIETQFLAPDGAYFSDERCGSRRESNPHMHFLEACLAWTEIGEHSGWKENVARLVELALRRFTHKQTGAIGEVFDVTQAPITHDGGRVEPGHQFEWAWLLLRSESYHSLPSREFALRLISIGEEFGVHHGVAVNALLDDLSVKDTAARLWPQTERLKAALHAACVTGESTYLLTAVAAVASLISYLQTPVRGLWFDQRLQAGNFTNSPAPASTLYHVVAAAVELRQALGHRRPTSTV